MNHRGVLSGQFDVLGPMIWQLFEKFETFLDLN